MFEESQQPLGHEMESHSHVPLTQCCPLAHSAPAPQVHVPDEEQVSAVIGHVLQAPPPVPHELGVPGDTQVDPEQHPEQVAAQDPQTPPVQA